MEEKNRALVRAGFVLFALALLTGLALPAFLNPKMGLAAHLTGILNGLVLIALGLAWGLLTLTKRQARLVQGLFLYAAFANWGGSILAASLGTGLLTPLSAAGHSAQPWQEGLVASLQISVAVTVLVGAVLVVHALRPPTHSAA